MYTCIISLSTLFFVSGQSSYNVCLHLFRIYPCFFPTNHRKWVVFAEWFSSVILVFDFWSITKTKSKLKSGKSNRKNAIRLKIKPTFFIRLIWEKKWKKLNSWRSTPLPNFLTSFYHTPFVIIYNKYIVLVDDVFVLVTKKNQICPSSINFV